VATRGSRRSPARASRGEPAALARPACGDAKGTRRRRRRASPRREREGEGEGEGEGEEGLEGGGERHGDAGEIEGDGVFFLFLW
jgi:hypothetical protein